MFPSVKVLSFPSNGGVPLIIEFGYSTQKAPRTGGHRGQKLPRVLSIYRETFDYFPSRYIDDGNLIFR